MGVAVKEMNISYPTADAVTLFFKPALNNPNLKARFRVMGNVYSEKDLRFIGKLDKILKAYRGCKPSGPTGSAVKITNRKVHVKRHEFRLEMCADELIDALEEGAKQFNKEWHDLTSTEFNRIISEMIGEAVVNDFYRKFWFDRFNAAAVADPDYNTINGLLMMINNLVAGSLIGYHDITALQGAPLPAGQSYLILDAMFEAQTDVFDAVEDDKKRFYVTKSIFNNYRKYLEALGTEKAHEIIVDGVGALTFRGVPVLKEQWDEELRVLVGASDQHRAVLSMPDNLVVASDSGATELAGVSSWYDKTERMNYWEGFLKFDANYVHEDFIVASF